MCEGAMCVCGVCVFVCECVCVFGAVRVYVVSVCVVCVSM